MPSDRITNTVCVASNSPTPDQMAAIHSHSHRDCGHCDCGCCSESDDDDPEALRGASIRRIVLHNPGGAPSNAANRLHGAGSGLALRETIPDNHRMMTKITIALLIGAALLFSFVFRQDASPVTSGP